MPKRKRTHNYRKSKRSKTIRRQTVSTVNKNNPLPNRFITKLRYEEQVNLNAGIATVAGHVFRSNSVYDPSFTSAGHQPRYFDEIIPLYDHFVVLGAKCTMIANNGNNEAMVCGIQLNDDGGVNTSVNDMIELKNSTWKILNEQNAGGSTKTIIKTFSPKTFLGRSNPLSDPDLKGSVNTNPTESAYFVCWAGGFSEAGDPASISARVIIDYIVAFIEPKRPTQS